jgi:cellulase
MLASFLLLAAAAATAHAHSVMQQLTVDGQAQGALTGIRVPATNGPVTDVTSNDIICNANLRDPLPKDVIDVKGGSKVGIEWHRTIGKLSSDVISKSHRGPIQVYMAKVNSATQADVTGLEWFKIAEQGFDAGSNTWATDDLIKNKGVFDVTVPSCIQEGDYIMRADITALHNARPNKANGAQIYIGCSQLKVSGTDGSATPSTVSFPGAYNPDDEGLHTNPFQKITNYPIPGPKVFSCDGSSQPDNSGDNTGDNAGDNTGDNTGDNAGDNTGDNNGDSTTTSAPDSTSTADSATKTSTKTTKTKTKTETATVTAAAFAKRDSSTKCRAKRGHA